MFIQVEWHRRASMYWVRFIHIELVGGPVGALVKGGSTIPLSAQEAPLAPGDTVRVRASVSQPRYKWGFIDHSCIGVITSE